ncbi:hypothetical protein [Kitasatospora sp. NBC_01539]|uniref:hypothetical protein n=1 Tax=Kitasatospora sp. NBC_01539 TaxID=2903577 RepID=UPI0038603250
MNTATGERRPAGLLLSVCALLLGLFLMHGAPSSAAGCHGTAAERTAGEPAPAAMAHAGRLDHTEGGVAAQAAADTADDVAARPGFVGMAGGELCVSTPAHGRSTPTPPTLLAVLGLDVLVGRAVLRAPAGRGFPRRRGPPRAGRAVLTQVCISRT